MSEIRFVQLETPIKKSPIGDLKEYEQFIYKNINTQRWMDDIAIKLPPKVDDGYQRAYVFGFGYNQFDASVEVRRIKVAEIQYRVLS